MSEQNTTPHEHEPQDFTERPHIDTHEFNELGYKIFLDRYALKDMSRESLAEGDIVIAILSSEHGQDMQGRREVAVIEKLDDRMARVVTQNGEVYDVKREHLDKPLETNPADLRARVAKGIASVEKDEADNIEAFEAYFEWLLDDWKFVPGGRILTAAGTDQKLSAFNCFVIESPKDSREGIFFSVAEMAEIMSRGGGVGVNVSSLRPRHAYVKGVNGRSSGSVSWAALFSYVTGLIEQAGCFASDVRIATDRGLLRIEEVVDRVRNQGERIFAQTHEGLREIVDTFDNGIQPVLRITTKRGFQIDVTPNHPMLYLDGSNIVDMRADHLQVGDDVLLLNSTQNFNNSEPALKALEEHEYPNSAKGLKFPEYMNPDLAYFLGYSYGDGWTDGKRLELATDCAHKDIEDKLFAIIENIFSKTPQLKTSTGDNSNRVVVSSVAIVGWMKSNGILKEKANDIRVPEVIFQSSSASQMAFVAGYFDADGGVAIKKKNVKISSVAIDMLRDVQRILATNGIMSQIMTWERPEEGWQDMNELSIRGNVHKKRFSEIVPSVKDVAPVIGKRDMTNMYPSSILSKYPSKYRQKVWDGRSERVSTNQIVKVADKALSRYEDTVAYDDLHQMLEMTIDTVISVEELGNQQTWDVTVDEVHKLSGNGFYTSNSRRGALMLILNDWHPDLYDFIKSKTTMGQVTNANISVGLSDAFMQAVKSDGDWTFCFPDTQHPQYDEVWNGDLDAWRAANLPVVEYGTVKARHVWDTIIESAWASAEPGLWFRERSNNMSNSYYYQSGMLVATNPCGELPLPANGVCNLGAINLSKFVIEPFAENGLKNVNMPKLKEVARTATRFLDNVVDYTYYVSDENYRQQQDERRLGLGIMGLAELMLRCGIRYGSEESVAFTSEIYHTIARSAYIESANLAMDKGAFPLYDERFLESGYMQGMDEDVRDLVKINGVRNVVILTTAPTGTTGTLMNTSTGIEPYFGWKWYRQGRLGWHEENAGVVQDYLDYKGIETDPSKPVTNYLPDYFVTAMELTPYEHVAVMGAAQRWIDSSISKTINAPNEYTIEQTSELYMHMYDLGVKGGTIYRDGSRNEQVLHRAEDIDAEGDSEGEGTTDAVLDTQVGSDAGVRLADHITLPDRPDILRGQTIKTKTPVGTAYIVVNSDESNQPFEVFITIGKAGSDVQAEAEGLGRMMSLSLQMQPQHLRYEALEVLTGQLIGIGGSRQVGFGPNRVLSLQDAVANAIRKHYFANNVVKHTNGHTPVLASVSTSTASFPDVAPTERPVVSAGVGAGIEVQGDINPDDLARELASAMTKAANAKPLEVLLGSSEYDAEKCPECGNLSLLRQEGCKKCLICGYSEC